MEKYALIVGASGGIGSAAAKRLAMDGYSLVLHYNRGVKEVVKLQQELPEKDVILIEADLAQEDGAKTLLKQLAVPIDLVVYTSGNSYVGLITDMKDEEVQKMIQLHVTSPFQLAKELLPAMIERKHGNMVMISSIWGVTGASCEVLYSMVKGAQNTFVKALAKEVAMSGIRVNAVAPGAVGSKMMDEFTEEDKALICEDIPMGRFGTCEEIADAIAFLASDQATYITGQILSVNGGWHT
ncbi:elongation factor P 5-aminopentanone reductase [Priestia abyssalis]|uniref:elongation factor P 5-aminopentanone reductase n=1 Tax=Priestia abyssalis TaxID=1221450 RepID=UPI000995BA81|nr:SDR family oxidoreductase [Priestia abyssalis]